MPQYTSQPNPQPSRHDTQAAFAAALVDRAMPMPSGLTAWTGPPARRFGVYRNNVAAGLTGAVASRYPAVEKVVGSDFFGAMAAAYVSAHPPRSPLLLDYAADFGDFIADFEPARELAYLPDLARLESARARAYHAADVAALEPAVLAAVPPDSLAQARLTPHPAFGLVRSPHPVVTIWAMNAGEAALAPIEEWVGEDALVVRPRLSVEVHRLPPGAAVLLGSLVSGAALGPAAEMAAEVPGFDLSLALAIALRAGAFATLSLGEQR
ncbi:DNA-binding domain-containing protein [Ancylobacter pratisalsi]|uniref:DUF2063 domain-containing protein n=1 Tax=Ancylobacter pratisalsi TaxID=1745854 RepID=A0A6P1YPZ4_9HYPH|nr:DNA-binding domain-containing protein [Ancylobacter pratisalsi]QIB34811.1 DUF2063 domain-containing protein [Ancylobacter pratisalsi]